ncbi:hypothetical protein SARC_02578 [Sphaeroforma arctica JP610]|uniref:Right handed beta helix domain-containing protein n=1 Tax=Sphaeroforma arctica JP610 TaxID=667725 RepID=A0A0L0GAG8_9EUKA|nr:hypothetical protein SARC_02578 [Sphaeroforma arctica JP610]KNC85243.1 hypothetical protein SARC_02578 [Sphaeroforma arctica JP610]|eukprot:XP_014159145.1 hypothetical protein SARC_02578 [Sphaeroforma arctica JP610]
MSYSFRFVVQCKSWVRKESLLLFIYYQNYFGIHFSTMSVYSYATALTALIATTTALDTRQVTVDACSCEGAVRANVCYDSLAAAIGASGEGDTITIGNTLNVDAPIEFLIGLTFEGKTCEGTKAKLVATFDDPLRAMLEPMNEDNTYIQNIVMSDFDVTSSDGVRAAMLHTPGDEAITPEGRVGLTLKNMNVYDMLSEYSGVAVWVGNGANILIDDDCKFTNLAVRTDVEFRYYGGAVTVKYLGQDYTMDIGGTFTNNSAFMPSLHTGGAALMFEWIEGDTNIKGVFKNNRANQGAVTHIFGLLGNMVLDGTFEGNEAVEEGYGSRGGVVRMTTMYEGGNLTLLGTYENNVSGGRGGVIASDDHPAGSTMTLNGKFINNTCLNSGSGAVWSQWSILPVSPFEGDVTILGTSSFEDNTSPYDDNRSSIWNINKVGKFSEDDWESETKVAPTYTE